LRRAFAIFIHLRNDQVLLIQNLSGMTWLNPETNSLSNSEFQVVQVGVFLSIKLASKVFGDPKLTFKGIVKL